MEHADFLDSFIEDTREHLADIEVSLIDLEQAGADADDELVNTIFRAAHSIKGSAGFLGLGNVRDVSHKLENLLHMIRNREVAADKRIVSELLAGFDRLKALVELGAASEGEDVSETLERLSILTQELLPESKKSHSTSAADVSLPGGPMIFSPDLLTLENSLAGGKYLYLVEYDLIHDVHARGKTPLDIIRTMESSGLIVDCRLDLAPVGDLDAPLSNKLPFYVLFATIVEPDVIGYLFALDSSCIHLIDPQELMERSRAQAPPAPEDLFGIQATTASGQATLLAPAELGADNLEPLRQALLTLIGRGQAAVLDLSMTVAVDCALVQLVCSAHKSFAAQGLALRLEPPGSQALAARLARLGFGPFVHASCGVATCPLLA